MSAIISPCGTYRYRLERVLPAGPGSPTVAVVMVNPSTADAEKDDATIRSLTRLGNYNGWGKLIVGNLFAYRATDVRELATAADPKGPDNGYRLAEIFLDADEVVFAWGSLGKLPPTLRNHWRDVDKLARSMHSLPLAIGKTCKDGHPGHPLFLPRDTPLYIWDAPVLPDA